MRFALNIPQKLYGLAILSALLYIVLGLTMSALKDRALDYADVMGDIYGVQERLLAANLHDHDFRQGLGARREAELNLHRAAGILDRMRYRLPDALARRVVDSREEILRQQSHYAALGENWDRLYHMQDRFKVRVAAVARLGMSLEPQAGHVMVGNLLFWVGRMEEVVASDLLASRDLPRFAANRRLVEQGFNKVQKLTQGKEQGEVFSALLTELGELDRLAGQLGSLVKENEALTMNLAVAEERVRQKVRELRRVAVGLPAVGWRSCAASRS